jgi:hypothetical protein
MNYLRAINDAVDRASRHPWTNHLRYQAADAAYVVWMLLRVLPAIVVGVGWALVRR